MKIDCEMRRIANMALQSSGKFCDVPKIIAVVQRPRWNRDEIVSLERQPSPEHSCPR